MDYQGGKYSSMSVSEKEAAADQGARDGVCLDYCQRGDAQVSAAYRQWKSTPDGMRARTGKSFDVDFQESLRPVYKACQTRCNADVAARKPPVTSCEPPGKPTECQATLHYKGKTYTAKSAEAAPRTTAQRLACRRHCKDDDPGVSDAYKTWLASPDGKKAAADREAELEREDALVFAVNACQSACVAGAVLDPSIVTLDCKAR